LQLPRGHAQCGQAFDLGSRGHGGSHAELDPAALFLWWMQPGYRHDGVPRRAQIVRKLLPAQQWFPQTNMTRMAAGSLGAGQVFISYVRQDAQPVDALREVLEAAGIEVWLDRDQLGPGDDWKLQIRRAIQNNSLAFIACFSSQSVARVKSYQNEELAIAAEEFRMRQPGVPWLFPVRFDDVDLPHYDLGAGRTLDSIQRTDLFGPAREPGQTRLAVRIAQMFQSAQGTSTDKQPTPSVTSEQVIVPASSARDQTQDDALGNASIKAPATMATHLKELLRDPSKDIALDDLVTETAAVARQECLDTERFPNSAAEMSSAVTAGRVVIKRTDEYWSIIQPLATQLVVGCAWGKEEHNALWKSAMRTIANTTFSEGGLTVLIEMRMYPRVMVLYAAGLGAVARDNYSALRAITVDARLPQGGRSLPVISLCNPWRAFSAAPVLAEMMVRHTEGQELTDDDLTAIARSNGGLRKTPVSDDLHSRLRETLTAVIRDDAAYDDTFDRLEVLLGLIAQDASDHGASEYGYVSGGWPGRYAWRNSSGSDAFEEIGSEIKRDGAKWPPLASGLFDGSVNRAEVAYSRLEPAVMRVRSLF
jgi:hypothetical protein